MLQTPMVLRWVLRKWVRPLEKWPVSRSRQRRRKQLRVAIATENITPITSVLDADANARCKYLRLAAWLLAPSADVLPKLNEAIACGEGVRFVWWWHAEESKYSLLAL